MLSAWTLGRDWWNVVLCPFIYTVLCGAAWCRRSNVGGQKQAGGSRLDRPWIGFHHAFESVWIRLNSGLQISFQHAFESVWTRLNSFEFWYQIDRVIGSCLVWLGTLWVMKVQIIERENNLYLQLVFYKGKLCSKQVWSLTSMESSYATKHSAQRIPMNSCHFYISWIKQCTPSF